MSFYDIQPWAAAQGRQSSWDQQKPPSRSGETPASVAEPFTAFLTQLEEVDRAIDNLSKSGKPFPGGPGHNAPARRDSFPVHGRGYTENGRSGGPSRHHSVSEYDGGRSGSSVGLQGYYASQRFQQQPQRPNDQDQMMQAKRRIAAQRERELRNYHQEQQYNRNSAAVKSERSLSPNAMNEEERRDLIARQHRALYGQEASLYPADGSAPRPSQDARASISGAGGRGPSPLAFDPFSMQKHHAGGEPAVQMPLRDQVPLGSDRRTSASPPSASRSNFGMGDTTSSSAANSVSSPITSPGLGSGNMPFITSQGGIAPIGSRPTPTAAAKSATVPKERSASAASNPGMTEKNSSLGGWGSSSGVWGAPKNSLGVQASVWG